MFDYVHRSELDAERERRIRAEAERDAAKGEIERLRSLLDAQWKVQERQAIMHHEEIGTLLKHTMPVQPEYSADALAGDNPPETVAEAMQRKASGRNEILGKRELIKELRAQRPDPHKTTGGPGSDDELSPEEEKRISEKVSNG